MSWWDKFIDGLKSFNCQSCTEFFNSEPQTEIMILGGLDDDASFYKCDNKTYKIITQTTNKPTLEPENTEYDTQNRHLSQPKDKNVDGSSMVDNSLIGRHEIIGTMSKENSQKKIINDQQNQSKSRGMDQLLDDINGLEINKDNQQQFENQVIINDDVDFQQGDQSFLSRISHKDLKN